MTDSEMIERLVKDMVEVALANNKILALGSFKKDDMQLLDEAIQLNNFVLTTFTNIEELTDDKTTTENSNTNNDEVISQANGDGNSEGVKVTRKGSL